MGVFRGHSSVLHFEFLVYFIQMRGRSSVPQLAVQFCTSKEVMTSYVRHLVRMGLADRVKDGRRSNPWVYGPTRSILRHAYIDVFDERGHVKVSLKLRDKPTP
jgi:hypothetical protein